LHQARTANLRVKRAAQDADHESTAEYQEAFLVEAIAAFKASELARRGQQRKGFFSTAAECADDEEVDKCIAVVDGFDANVAGMKADGALVNELARDMKEDFEAKRIVAKDLHELAAQEESSGWRDTVEGNLFAETKHGIGCPEVECIGEPKIEPCHVIAPCLLCVNSLCRLCHAYANHAILGACV